MNQNIAAMKPADLVEEFIRLRDEKKRFDDLAEMKSKEVYGDRMEAIKVTLLDLLNKLGVDSIAGHTGTAFKSISTSVTVGDAREFRRHVIGGEHWDLINWVANKTAVNELVERGEPLPPGINRSAFYNINVRRKSS